MSQKCFLQDDTKAKATEAVQAIELQTSAEIVVSVRVRSGEYQIAAYHFGLVAMGITFLVLWLIPVTFTIESIVLNAMSVFFIALLAALFIAPLSRYLTRKRVLEQNCRTSARALFYELGISRTSGRNGLLVFVSLFERQCVLVPDIGIDEALLGEPWEKLREELSASIQRLDRDAFIITLRQMGPILGAVMPRAEDDVNELPDEVC